LAVKAGIGENESLIVNISTRQIKVDEPVYKNAARKPFALAKG